MSARADRRLRDRARLPMQWSLQGKVNWTAPRRIALAFTPMLAALVLSAMALGLGDDPAGRAWPLGTVALGFVGAHALHLWLIGRDGVR